MSAGTFRRFGLVVLAFLAAAGLDAGAAAREGHSGKATPAAKGRQAGLASYYGPGLQGKKTASGQAFDKSEMVAAHPSYPLGTRARVTNLRNGLSEEVQITDRGPTPEIQRRGVVIDVSEGVANKLGFRKRGKTRVEVQVLEWGEKNERLAAKAAPGIID